MTEAQESEIRAQFHKSADVQADAIIMALREIDRSLAGYSDEQKETVIKMVMEQSYKAVEESSKQYAEQMTTALAAVKNMEEKNG